MSKPYDAGLRGLIEQYPPDWLALAPRTAQGPVRIIDSDLSTISAQADKVLLIEDPLPWILHIEPQASRDGALEKRLSWYNELLSYKHDCLVHSVVVLLRREADSLRLSGEFVQQFPGETPFHVFRYQVVRIWQQSAETLAQGGWGLFPLALLCDDARARLPDLLEQMANRLKTEIADPQQMATLWKTTAILADMRYDQDLILPLMRKVMNMVNLEEFPSYAKGLAVGEAKGLAVGEAKGKTEGLAEGLRRTIILLGEKRLGATEPRLSARLNAIQDVNLLQRMVDRLLDVQTWQDLFADETKSNPN